MGISHQTRENPYGVYDDILPALHAWYREWWNKEYGWTIKSYKKQLIKVPNELGGSKNGKRNRKRVGL
jgi:hypothetical protein